MLLAVDRNHCTSTFFLPEEDSKYPVVSSKDYVTELNQHIRHRLCHPENSDLSCESHSIANSPRAENPNNSEYENHSDEHIVSVRDILLRAQKRATKARDDEVEGGKRVEK